MVNSVSPQNIQPEQVEIRLFRQRLDWHPTMVIHHECGINGELDLERVRIQLGVNGICWIISPQNFQPFHRYNGHIVEADDLRELGREGYIRIIAEK
jgi:hypothetical protein